MSLSRISLGLLVILALSACVQMRATPAQPTAGTAAATTAAATATPATAAPATAAAEATPGEPVAAQNMRLMLQQWLGDEAASAQLSGLREAEWPDACFGAGYANESCALVITPGWEMTFTVNSADYVFRTDPQAYRFRLTQAPEPRIGETLVSWTGGDGITVDGCARAEVGTQAVAFGDCFGLLVAGAYMAEPNRQTLAQHIQRFAPFEAQTSAGTVTFNGQGQEEASPADQRSISELAQLMYFEARTGRATSAFANALAFTRQGTLPACLTVDVVGRVATTDCAPDATPITTQLNPGGLAELYRWLDELAPLDITITETGTITRQLVLAGRGPREATEEDRRALLTFAEGLVGESRAGQPSAGALRYALPLVLPQGLDWDPRQSEVGERSFRARAVDPLERQWRWASLAGSLDAPTPPADPGTPVQVRGQPGAAYNFGEGYAVTWLEEGTHFTMSSSFGLTETLEMAQALHPTSFEDMSQLLREREQGLKQLDTFGAALGQAAIERDFDALRTTMGPTFTLGLWRSQGQTLTPEQAIEQLRENYLVADSRPQFMPFESLPGVDLRALAGPDAPSIAQAVFSTGWGADAQAEAVLLFARDADGTPYWHSVLIAPDGFR